MAKDEELHARVGSTAAKYVETLQRSNEQLVKLCGLMSKQDDNDELSEKDLDNLFDAIQKEGKKDA